MGIAQDGGLSKHYETTHKLFLRNRKNLPDTSKDYFY